MIMESEQPPFAVTELPRGGTLVEAGDFRLQLGSYPETIKDTMKLERGVPDLYLLPDELFDTFRGISNSDLEFPVYFNYFIKQRRCRFICHRHQLRPIIRVLREAVVGPFKLFTEKEYPEGKDTPGFPDMRKEMRFYKEDPSNPRGYWGLKDMITFYLFDDTGEVEVDGTRIQSLGRNKYRLLPPNQSPIPCEFRPTREAQLCSPEPQPVSDEPYEPPRFGVTVIGSGHGFDSESKTSGFIIWVDGKGIMVDPPVNSTEWMRQHRVNARLVEDLVLTHCHADHDSGTLQKVLEEGRIRIHTTETVLKSFVAKYASITQLKSKEFLSLFQFEPLIIGQPTTIAGASFLFKYNLHPIPTLGFQVKFQEKSFYYSCDTLYCPDTIESLYQKGVLSADRRDDLLDVPWESSLLLHEAGIPPIHTPMSVLQALPEEVKSHMYLVHVSESAIPADSGLRLATPGIEGTMEIAVTTPAKSLATKILDVASHIDLFADMKFKKALECLAITQSCHFEPGETIIKRGTYGDKFYMIASGVVEVLHESLPQRLFFARYDYIGETALVLNEPRNADIVALTRTELLAIERNDFLRFIRDSELPTLFKRLNDNRSGGARWTFEKHRVLAALSPLQKNQLMCSMICDRIPEGESLFELGRPVEWYFLIDTGEVLFQREDGEAVLGPGSFLGEFDSHFEASRHGSQARAKTDLQVYKVPVADMRTFFNSYPGTFVRMSKSLKDSLRRSFRPTGATD